MNCGPLSKPLQMTQFLTQYKVEETQNCYESGASIIQTHNSSPISLITSPRHNGGGRYLAAYMNMCLLSIREPSKKGLSDLRGGLYQIHYLLFYGFKDLYSIQICFNSYTPVVSHWLPLLQNCSSWFLQITILFTLPQFSVFVNLLNDLKDLSSSPQWYCVILWCRLHLVTHTKKVR